MNIFILDKNTVRNAKYHCITHSIKMVVELGQILSTVLQQHGISYGYKPTHKNHPCTIWAGINKSNFKYTRKLGLEICKEYTFRYGKKHSAEDILRNMECPSTLPKGRLTEFAQAMPDKYRNEDSVKAYRNYYLGEKLSQDGRRWGYKNREIPDWVKGEL
jgi:hypothetical protein